jgi:hypothetical protein
MQIDRDKPERTAGDASLAVLMDVAEKKAARFPDILRYPAWKLFEYERRRDSGESMPNWWSDETARKYQYLAYVGEALARVEADSELVQTGAGT